MRSLHPNFFLQDKLAPCSADTSGFAARVEGPLASNPSRRERLRLPVAPWPAGCGPRRIRDPSPEPGEDPATCWEALGSSLPRIAPRAAEPAPDNNAARDPLDLVPRLYSIRRRPARIPSSPYASRPTRVARPHCPPLVGP